VGVADALTFAIVAHLNADVGVFVIVVEIPTLVAFVELDEELTVVPGESRDIRVIFGVAFESRVSSVFF